MKLLGIFFVVFIAQTQVAQGSPILSLNILGDVVGTTTGLVTGPVITIVNTLEAALQLLDNILTSVVGTIGDIKTQAITDIGNSISGLTSLVNTIGSTGSVDDIVDDTVAIATASIKDAATQIQQIKENALTPLRNFYSAISNMFLNNTALLSNPIGSVKEAISGLSNEINAADFFQIAFQIIKKVVSFTNKILAPVVKSIGAVEAKLARSVPSAMVPGFNALNTITSNLDNVLNAATNLTTVFGNQAATATQGLATTVLPLTGTLSTAVTSAVNAVKSISVVGNAAITAINNAASSLLSAVIPMRHEIVAGIAGAGTACANKAATAVLNLTIIYNYIGVECVNNELPTLQNYISQFAYNADQYQTGITTNTISISALRQTIQNAVGFKLYLISVKLRIESCFANTLLNYSADLLPIAKYDVTCAK